MNKKTHHERFKALVAPKNPPKVGRLLLHLCRDGSLNKLEAGERLGEYELSRAISRLANDHCIQIIRNREVVAAPQGSEVVCTRYHIDPAPENLDKCYRLLRRRWGFSGPDAPPSVQFIRPQ